MTKGNSENYEYVKSNNTLLSNQYDLKKGKSEKTLRWMKMRIQYIKTYGMQQNLGWERAVNGYIEK